MTGQQTKSPRWKECAQGTINLLPLAGGALYVRRHFDSTDKEEALVRQPFFVPFLLSLLNIFSL